MSWENIISISFSKSKNPLVFVSKFLSVFGMAAGCFSIITALSVMNGFEKLIRDKLRGFEGDLRISGIYDENILPSQDDYLFSIDIMGRKITNVLFHQIIFDVYSSGKVVKRYIAENY